MIPNIGALRCDNCKILNLGFSSNYVCNPGVGCPNNTVLDTSSLLYIDRNGCRTCMSINKFYDNGICVDQCPYYKIVDSNNICNACSGSLVKQFQSCVNQCNDGFNPDSNNVCMACQNNSYLFGDQCVNSCPNLYGIDNNNVCSNCLLLNPSQFMYNGRCTLVMPSTTTLINSQFNEFRYVVVWGGHWSKHVPLYIFFEGTAFSQST